MHEGLRHGTFAKPSRRFLVNKSETHEWKTTRGGKNVITRGKGLPAVEMAAGVVRETLGECDRMLMARFSLKSGSRVPLHQHPHEQVGYAVSGRLRLTIDKESHVIEAGDSYFIPAGVPHAAEAITDCIAVDVFSPPREDYRNTSQGHAATSCQGSSDQVSG
jgi:quercetin dioxygenase-like cupin family protein